MSENRIQFTPIKFFIELISLKPHQVLRVLLGNKLSLIEDAQVIQLLKQGVSLVRWADGETALARNKSIGYQSSDLELAKKLNSLFKMRDDSLIIGIPSAITESLISKNWSLKRLQILLSTRLHLSKIDNADLSYICDTFFWYRNFQNIEKIVSFATQGRQVLLVASNEEYLKFVPSGTKFIRTKTSDAFLEYKSITTQLNEFISESSSPVAILCACGPTSKAIVIDFKEIAQVIDVGHGFSFAVSGEKKYAWEI